MNYIKLQQEIIKIVSKHKNYNWFCTVTDNKAVLTDGYVLYVIPKCYWLLNADMLGMKVFSDHMLQTLLEVPDEIVTDTHIEISEDKKTLMQLNGDKYITFIDKDKVKFFEGLSEYELHCKGPKQPVYLINFNGEISGMILPVFRKQV